MLYTSSPHPFWHQGLVSWKTIFPQMGWGGHGPGSNASNGGEWFRWWWERWGMMRSNRWSFARLPAAHLLLWAGVGDPCYILCLGMTVLLTIMAFVVYHAIIISKQVIKIKCDNSFLIVLLSSSPYPTISNFVCLYLPTY